MMSAFVVAPNVIKELALVDLFGPFRTYATIREEAAENAELVSDVADDIWKANIKSVRIRYPQETLTTLPGDPISLTTNGDPAPLTISPADVLAFSPPVLVSHITALVRNIDCIEYQSCEDPDFYTSKAYNHLTRIRKALTTRLPGYQAEDWPSEMEPSQWGGKRPRSPQGIQDHIQIIKLEERL
jgi:hypothetical protein